MSSKTREQALGKPVDTRTNTLHLVPCDPIIGAPRVPAEQRIGTAADLAGEMARLDISRSFVRHRACADLDPWLGNRLLGEDLTDHSELSPAWCLTPEGQSPEFDIARVLRDMTDAGARLAWIAPKDHRYEIRAWCCGELCEALQAAQIPLLLNDPDCRPDDIHDLCRNFPDLRLILLRVSRLGRHRMLFPLLEKHENLYVCFDHTFSVFKGFETMVGKFGEHRWVFGMGYPDAECGAAVTGLLCSGLSDRALEAVGHGNIERLTETAPPPPQPTPSRMHAVRLDPLAEAGRHGEPITSCRVVDAHGHLGTECPVFPIISTELDDVLASMDRLGVDLFCVSGIAGIFGAAGEGNDVVAAAIRRAPDRFFGYATVDIGFPERILPELERCLELGFRGVKIWSWGDRPGLPYDHENYQPVFAFADANHLPILAHTWGAELDQLRPAIERFANINWLMAHTGSQDLPKYIEFGRQYPTVFLETCFSPCPYGLIEELVAAGLEDKVVWGSDVTFMDSSQQLGRVTFARIPVEAKQKILGGNANKALRLEA